MVLTLLARPPARWVAQSESADPDLDTIVESVRSMGETTLAVLPRVGIALVVLVVGWLVAGLVRRLVQPRLARLRTPSFGQVFATLVAVAIRFLAVFAAVAIVFPSVDVATLLAGMGVLGIAAGFAFQDILSNLLAGILLIFRQPFVSGDQIEVDGLAGTVEGITIRETRLTTFDNRLVVVPNQDVYTNAITVQTAHDTIRSSFVTGVGYDSDLDQVTEVTTAALATVDGVIDEPAPQVYAVEHGSSAIVLDVRYWTASRQSDVRAVQDRVVRALFDAYNDADIDMPFDVLTLDADERLGRALRPGRDASGG